MGFGVVVCAWLGAGALCYAHADWHASWVLEAVGDTRMGARNWRGSVGVE